MNEKINVLDLMIDNHTAKEAMKLAMGYMQTDWISTVEIVSVNTLVKAGEMPELKAAIESLDMIIAGDKAILEAAGITDYKCIQEIENQMFLKMLMRYMHKNHKRVFLLADSEEQSILFQSYLEQNYRDVVLTGVQVVPPQGTEYDDMIINTINGIEVDCVIAVLDAPTQEAFIVRNRTLLNAKMWLGLGKDMKMQNYMVGKTRWVKEYIAKKIFKHQIEKHKKEV